ncbi:MULTISPECIES: nucleotide disphospho-sugar-binding domain-containing protein [unclassified Nocardiopsis]|uniref:nucleotide disphospho-sugar-binding domain-containing protein n=1 Tax=Nocardiopsis TaxID=2013 RepID=UPI00387B705B
MKVMFTVSDWLGVYNCIIPLGWALEAAGHEVRVVCAPSQVRAVTQGGLVPVPLFESYDVMKMERMERYGETARASGPLDDSPVLHPETGEPVVDFRLYDADREGARLEEACHEVIDRRFDAAAGFARDWRPDLVVHDLLGSEGVLAAAVAGVPCVYHGPGMFGAVESCVPDRTGALARHGVAQARPPIGYVIDSTPPSVGIDHGDALHIPMRYVPYNGPGRMEPWLLEEPDPRRLCLLWSRGTHNIFGNGAPVFPRLLEAAADLDVEVVFTGPPEAVHSLDDLPGRVRVLTDFPLKLLLPTCGLIAHQGSVNPMMTAAALGLPQLMLGMADDGMEMGRRFALAGSGLALSGLSATTEEIRGSLAALLDDPSAYKAARRIREENEALPAPAEVVRPLELLARTGTLTAADL